MVLMNETKLLIKTLCVALDCDESELTMITEDTPINLNNLQKELDNDVNYSYISDEPFNSIVLAESLKKIADKIKEKSTVIIPDRLPSDKSTVEYGGNKITLRRTPEYLFPKHAKINRINAEIEGLETEMKEYKESIKQHKEQIKTIKEQLIEQGKAIYKGDKHSIIVK